jgi:hypothetical protein
MRNATISSARRLGAFVAIALAVALGGGALVVPADVAAASTYRMNLARKNDFVAQTNFVQCVGASMQMMLNIVEPGADRSRRTQRQLQDLARAWSGPRPDGSRRQGASIRGWAAGLIIRRAGAYRIVGANSLQQAMKIAATAIRTHRRPVGLLVWRGRHAWVMSGFEATSDPLLATSYTVTRAYVLDPLYPHGSDAWGPSPKPGTAVSIATVGKQFVRRSASRNSPWNRLPGGNRFAGKWVLLVPTGQVRPGIE